MLEANLDNIIIEDILCGWKKAYKNLYKNTGTF